ncbi:Nucleic acid-binding [Abeliophyllum distichum]|uniref:Nucleic acid-binding n=1 Tax=Abeliophyllum distichum TaxID=126358 RepID=A0ABD1NPT9_9LAMI
MKPKLPKIETAGNCRKKAETAGNCRKLPELPKKAETVFLVGSAKAAKLSVGDVVKCCIKKITYFGIFVEVEGVPALIHQTEVSWDATLDPESYFKVGQPDPLMEALEAVVGDHNSLGGRLEAAEADIEVYMASMFENQYKLLARAGNRVQEVIVQTSMGKEELKSAILTCTNRVE